MKRPPSSASPGFTLLEILAALLVSTMVAGLMVNLLVVSARTATQTQGNVESSTSVFRLSSLFADDMATGGLVAGVTTPMQRGQLGCGNVASVVRIVSPGTSAAVVVRSYTRVVTGTLVSLERRQCSGSSLAAALGATWTSEVVVPDLGTSATSAAVSCDSDPPMVDADCKVVTLTVTTTTGASFSVQGQMLSTLTPTPTTTVVPIHAPPTGTCTIGASDSGWGATGGEAGGSGSNYGDYTMYTYNDTNQRNSFIKFDLGSPCIGAGDTWPTLPGGRLLTSVTLSLTWLGTNNAKCWIFPGISYKQQDLDVLDTSSTWSESTLTGSDMPGATRTSYAFNAGNSGTPTKLVDATITNAVKQWYTAGGWKNNGFRLRRSGVGDTCGDSNMFASRFNPNVSQRPMLVITWG